MTGSDDGLANIIDVTRTAAVARGRALVLTAALSHGLGWRTATETVDLLMQNAPEDLFAESQRQLGLVTDNRMMEEVQAGLNMPLHPSCFLSPYEFACKFGLDEPEHVGMHTNAAQVANATEFDIEPQNTPMSLTTDDLTEQEFVELHNSIPIFRLRDGRYHVVSNFAVATLEEARVSAAKLKAAVR